MDSLQLNCVRRAEFPLRCPYRTSEIFVVECQSFLDSPEIRSFSFINDKYMDAKQYKLFVQEQYREVVVSRLKEQLIETGRCQALPKVGLCLDGLKYSSLSMRAND